MRLLRRALLVLLGVVFLVGCGTSGLSEEGDPSAGKALFQEKCSRCHTLAAASATGDIGPNLDEAFAGPRREGFDETAIRELVRGQIDMPSPASASPDVPPMPPDLFEGEEADAVAAYVAMCAANTEECGEGGITATGGKSIFAAAGCGGCHVLADAGSTGTIGPSLDRSKPGLELVIQRVTNGKGAMPSFKDRLSEAQIRAVAEYVARVAGKR